MPLSLRLYRATKLRAIKPRAAKPRSRRLLFEQFEPRQLLAVYAVNDSWPIDEDTTLVVSVPGVLDNDS